MSTSNVAFVRRASRRESFVTSQRIWRSRCGRYQVIESTSRFRKTKSGRAVVTYFAVELNELGQQRIVSCHRNRQAAMRALERQAQS